ncbi:HAD family hydrolase [Winogradskyella psychrotolerans]|uniref:HAD family hydrolase n=1 Tax=Winogradskyella psychrotolerans TaxID=1344585 RepID=UPI001C07A05C|nr:HAD family hydrolase [Winogradskyella psychrotolerans]MBU2929007.1 HAD family hydrolase [Winogradskyella psychrotolerans]
MKDVKMVVTDMDGTLLNYNHDVSSRFFELFKDLKQQNIQFVAASGRPYYSIVEKLQSIKDDIIIVAENGGLVIQNENVLLSNLLNPDRLLELYQLVTSIENTYPIFCTKDQAFILRASDELVQTFSEYYSVYTIIDSFEDITEDVIKIALYHTTNSEAHIFPFVKHLKPELNVVVSGNHWVDISEAITNKGNAITFLQKQLNITPSETMVFGDYNNDLEMLKCAEYSYAMKNAHSDVKAIANFETETNDNNGVELVLEALIAESR